MNGSGSKPLHLSQYFTKATLLLLGGGLLVALLVYQSFLLPIVKQQDILIEQRIAEDIIKTLSQNLKSWQQAQQEFAAHAPVQKALAQNDEQALAELTTQLHNSLSEASVLTIRPATANTTANPTVILRETASNNIELSIPVLSAQHQWLGTITATIDSNRLVRLVNRYSLDNQYGELRQSAVADHQQVITHYGNAAVKVHQPDIVLAIEETPWQLAVWYNPADSVLATRLASSFMLAAGIILLFSFILLKIGHKRLKNALSYDLEVLNELLKDQPVNIQQLPSFRLNAFNSWLSRFMQRSTPIIDPQLFILPSIAPTADLATIYDKTPATTLDYPEHEALEKNTPAISRNIFRAYDIRGIVGETLTPEIIQEIGAAIGSEARELGLQEIVIARDGRVSGPVLSEALCHGLLSTGINVIDIGAVPTPVLYYAAQQWPSLSGIMLTGSHNPTNYNGLKIVLNSETLANEKIIGLYQRIIDQNFVSGDGDYKSSFITDDYVQAIVNDITITKPLRIVIDAGNGIAGDLGVRLFEELGCHVTPLFCEVDGNFPNHHPDPSVPDNLKDLIEMVKSEEADVGIAFDGDGDRLGIVSNTGEIIWPDRQMMLFASDVLSRNPGSNILYDVKCTRHLAEIITQHNGQPIMWKTGHSLIKAKMRETHALLAGEMSGHIFFKERWLGFDDALYSGARLLEILSQDKEQRTLQEIFDTYPNSVNTPEIKIEIAEEKKFVFIDQFKSQAAFENATISTIDGLRADFADGWGLVRPSNTTSCLVLRFEGKDEASLQRIQLAFKTQLLQIDYSLQVPF